MLPPLPWHARASSPCPLVVSLAVVLVVFFVPFVMVPSSAAPFALETCGRVAGSIQQGRARMGVFGSRRRPLAVVADAGDARRRFGEAPAGSGVIDIGGSGIGGQQRGRCEEIGIGAVG